MYGCWLEQSVAYHQYGGSMVTKAHKKEPFPKTGWETQLLHILLPTVVPFQRIPTQKVLNGRKN